MLGVVSKRLPEDEISMLDMILYGIFWLFFILGVCIELVSIYFDIQRMRGRSKVSGAWGGALGLFGILGLYSIFLGSRQHGRTVPSIEFMAVVIAVVFQVIFHVLFPLAIIYLTNRKDANNR